MFPGFKLAAVVLTMSMSIAFYLDPGAVFDVGRASGVNSGVDVSADVDM